MAAIVVLPTCNGCGRCVEVCPFNVYEIIEFYAIPERSDECVECCACVMECPQNSIQIGDC